ncbi:TPA: hypothetical protein HA270_00085, partial [Candidatus Woesearchaeota archaeon]|nr:hypothetical protein [Candidatus Woesearchaeota archaeon]
LAHAILITVFAKEEESLAAVKEGLVALLAFDNPENENIMIEQRIATGFNERRISIFSTKLSKERHTFQFIRRLIGLISKKDMARIRKELESRVDEECNFFLRFEKGPWNEGRKLVLTDSGECYHIRMSVAAFPAKREVALAVLRELL